MAAIQDLAKVINQHYTGDKSSNLNDTITSQNKGGTNRKKTLIVGDSIVKNIEEWRLNKRMSLLLL